tara:strand:- start:463 stop:837 length:375 start_codon:yes stop_codon:yes gene_type:complete
MTVKLLLLKSGEDVIADVSEMVIGDGDERRVIGYRLERPCVIKMRNPNIQGESGTKQKAGFEVSLFPWIPLTKEENIPIPADWLITLVEPVENLALMYNEDVKNGNGTTKSTSIDDGNSTDKSD